MAQPIILPSFAAGEISPSLLARVDLAKYHVGASLLRNFFVDYRGGASNRTGTEFVCDSLDASQITWLIPFVFSTVQAYVLVFCHFKMQVVMNGGLVIDGGTGLPFILDTPYAAADLPLLKFAQSADVLTLVHPNYAPRQLTRTAHDEWTISLIDFAPQVQPVSGVTVVPSMTGDATHYRYVVTSIASNGLTESLPSDSADSGDSKTMTVTLGANCTISWTAVPGAQLYNVYRTPEVAGGSAATGQFYGFVGSTSGTSFVDANINPDFSRTPPQDFNPFLQGGQLLSVVTSDVGRGYTAIPALAFTGGGGSGAAATVNYLSLYEIATLNQGMNYVVGDVLYVPGDIVDCTIRVFAVNGVGGITSALITVFGKFTTVPANPLNPTGGSGTNFQCNALFGIGNGSDVISITNVGSQYTTAPSVAPVGGGAPTVVATFSATVSPSVNNNPSVTTYFQQRQVFAATLQQPQTFWLSKSGDFHNFGFSTPARPDDGIIGTIAATQVNAIKHIVPMQSLIMLSNSAAWKVDGGQPGVPVTPSSLQAIPQAYNGCSDVPPIVINYDILYVQAKGAIVRDLAYNFYVNIFTGADMTVLANHLFYGHQIKQWAYAEEPFKIIWAVRDDGVLLSFTFLKEQDVYAWAHHDTQGKFRSVCVIPEGDEDAVYAVVERYISGTRHRYVERLASRNMGAVPEEGVPADLARAWFVDCGLQYPQTYPDATLYVSATTAPYSIRRGTVVFGGSGYTSTPTIVITDPTGTGGELFAFLDGAGAIFNVVVISAGTNYTNPTITVTGGGGSGAIVTVDLERLISCMAAPAVSILSGDKIRMNHGWGTVRAVQGGFGNTNFTVAIDQPLSSTWPALPGEWTCTTPVSTVSGLGHLEGELVSILADGNVQPQQRVAGGTVTLQEPASAIVVGLPYVAQLETLYIDTGEMPTVQGKRKKIPAVTARIQDSRGFKVGPDFDHLDAPKERRFQLMGQPILPGTGDERVLCNSDWNVQGQVCVQQDNPLPVTILGLMPEIVVGDTP